MLKNKDAEWSKPTFIKLLCKIVNGKNAKISKSQEGIDWVVKIVSKVQASTPGSLRQEGSSLKFLDQCVILTTYKRFEATF